jgi:hypothetical protein
MMAWDADSKEIILLFANVTGDVPIVPAHCDDPHEFDGGVYQIRQVRTLVPPVHVFCVCMVSWHQNLHSYKRMAISTLRTLICHVMLLTLPRLPGLRLHVYCLLMPVPAPPRL